MVAALLGTGLAFKPPSHRQLYGANSYDHLIELQRHSQELAAKSAHPRGQ
jgi:hypothetical protein